MIMTEEQLTAFCKHLLNAQLPQLVPLAIERYRSRTQPISIDLLKLLVWAYRELGDYAKAAEVQPYILRAIPGDIGEQYNYADLLLALGRYEIGWKKYFYRYQMEHTKKIARHVTLGQRWNGQPIKGRRLYLFDEQGLGDTIQFIRFILLAQQVSEAEVFVEVTDALYEIIKRSFPTLHIIRRRDQLEHWDYYCELMNLPLALGTTLENIPAPQGYLTAAPERLAYWRNRLEALGPTRKIALVWAGNPSFSADAIRSPHITPYNLLPSDPRLQYLSVQKGYAEQEYLLSSLNIHSLSSEISDFDDTAAILLNCDLFITSDTSPAHLAGALGVPTWVALPFLADWRWLRDRTDSPWYSTLRLYRQSAARSWNEVFTHIQQDITREFLTS